MSISTTHLATLNKPRGEAGVAPPALSRAVRHSVFLAFLCTSVLTAGLGAYAIRNIAMVGELTDQAIDAALVSISDARAASVDFNALEAAVARSRALSHQAGLQPRIDSLSRMLDGNLAAVAQRASTPEAAQAAVDARTAIASWRVAGGLNAAEASDEDRLGALARVVTRQLERLINHAAGDGLEFAERARATLVQARSQLLLGVCAALTLSGLLAILLARQITGLIAGATNAEASRIAARRLAMRIPDAGTDQLQALVSSEATT